ncbi:MAG: acyl-CoA thioesterase [Deltaproteobacteria bacterium]
MENTLKGKTVNESRTTFTQIVMPNDTNPLGNLMGGNIMRWMDIAGGICASKHSGSFVVTASVDNVSFKSPVKVGDVITINAQVTRAFNTSVEVFIEVFSTTVPSDIPVKSNNAYFTFVAIDPNTFKPTPIKPVVPVSEDEVKRYEGASRRRELRLVLGGKMDPKDATDLRQYFRELD